MNDLARHCDFRVSAFARRFLYRFARERMVGGEQHDGFAALRIRLR